MEIQTIHIIWGMRAVVFIAVTVLVHHFLKYFRESRVITDAAVRIYGRAEEKYAERKKAKDLQRLEEGNIKDASFLNKIDFLLERSHIKHDIPFMNTEVYILFNIIAVTAGLGFGIFILNDWAIGAILGAIVILCAYSVIYFKAGKNYDKIDNEMMTMLNIMENYSGSTDDILSIIGGTYMYLKEPLHTYLADFYTETNVSGDIGEAFRKLEVRIENERLRDTIRNLEICSRHDANYKEIIEDSKRSLKEYLRAKEKRKAITMNGRVEIGLTIGMAVGTVYMFDGMIGGIIDQLRNNFVGNIILGLAILVLVSAVWNMISIDKGDKK